MKRTTIMLPEELVERARERYGTRGLGPRVRELLEADLDGRDADQAVAALQRGASQEPSRGLVDPRPGAESCDHPKGRRLRGQCMACGWYVG